MVKHIGFASLRGGTAINERLIKHFMKINKCDRTVFQKHLKSKIETFENQSKYEWELDLSKLQDFE
jgi:hypothetical protein